MTILVCRQALQTSVYTTREPNFSYNSIVLRNYQNTLYLDIFFRLALMKGIKIILKRIMRLLCVLLTIFTLLMPQLICTPCTLCARSDWAFVYEMKLVNNYYTRNLTFNCCQYHLKPTIAIHLLWSVKCICLCENLQWQIKNHEYRPIHTLQKLCPLAAIFRKSP